MALPPGTRVGAFEVTGSLGAGGMGEVYRARDTRLDRDVALKILPPEFARDAERVARFRREAKTLASINHPHIAHLHGLEETSDGTLALVMELVDGEDLADRLKRGPLPLDEVLPIAKQIAEALEAAHELGIVHRDLKPANIKVRADGMVKVLDFGLAKAIDPASGSEDPVSGSAANSPTITSPAMTMRGVILGTAAYMAPEQAKGKPVDRRADIWAFGCVLYGRYLAFEVTASGRKDVFVRPFPEVDQGGWQVSPRGGSRPLWGPDGRELFYVGEDSSLQRVAVETNGAFTFGPTSQLIQDVSVPVDAAGRPFDIARDGRRFLFVRDARRPATGSDVTVGVALNWADTVLRRSATGSAP